MERCRRKAQCSFPGCKFIHPEVCSEKGCSLVDCRYWHPWQLKCFFGSDCFWRGCRFLHGRNSRDRDQKERCRYWAKCSHPSCRFKHPELCPSKDCTLKDCEFRHPERLECSLRSHCTQKGCPFLHGKKDNDGDEKVLCKQGTKCSHPGCKFAHPERCPIEDCALADCGFWHPERLLCFFNLKCEKEDCPFIHSRRANVRDEKIMCNHGAKCSHPKCTFVHPKRCPAQDCASEHCEYWHPEQLDCFFGSRCKKSNCPFRHERPGKAKGAGKAVDMKDIPPMKCDIPEAVQREIICSAFDWFREKKGTKSHPKEEVRWLNAMMNELATFKILPKQLRCSFADHVLSYLRGHRLPPSSPPPEPAPPPVAHSPVCTSPMSAKRSHEEAIGIPEDEQGMRCTICKKIYPSWSQCLTHMQISHREPSVRVPSDATTDDHSFIRYVHIIHNQQSHSSSPLANQPTNFSMADSIPVAPESLQLNFCPDCGTPLGSGFQTCCFCPQCGTPLAAYLLPS